MIDCTLRQNPQRNFNSSLYSYIEVRVTYNVGGQSSVMDLNSKRLHELRSFLSIFWLGVKPSPSLSFRRPLSFYPLPTSCFFFLPSGCSSFHQHVLGGRIKLLFYMALRRVKSRILFLSPLVIELNPSLVPPSPMFSVAFEQHIFSHFSCIRALFLSPPTVPSLSNYTHT